jgi:tetratricopeptide (TPR) repeat protein
MALTLPALLWGQPGGGVAPADPASQLQAAYREAADPKTRSNACKTFLEIGTKVATEATREMRANALLHYADLFVDCRAAAPGPYNSALDVYQEVIGTGTDPQKALAANNLAAACYDTDRPRAIRVLSQIPFDGTLPANSRAEYRINLAHLYVVDQQWGPAMETYRLALNDGADPRQAGAEMQGLVAPLAGYKGSEHSWAGTVADVARVLSERGVPAEGAKLIRTAFEQKLSPADETTLVTALLLTYAALPVDLGQFAADSSWLENSAHPALRQIAAAALDNMGIWLTERGIPASRYFLLMPPERDRPGARDTMGRPMREAFSQFLARLGGAWAAAEQRPEHTLQAEARYTLAWVIWPKNISAAVRSAALAGPISTTQPKTSSRLLRALRRSYSPSSIETAYLTGTQLSSLFELYEVFAESPDVEQSLLEQAVEIRSRLQKRGIEVAPAPNLLHKLAAMNEERHQSTAARLYLQASHDFERAGLPEEALRDLAKALGLSSKIDLSHLALSAGQRDLVGLAGIGPGDWSVKAEIHNPGDTLPPVSGTVKTGSDGRAFYRIATPAALAGGAKVVVRIYQNGTLVRSPAGELPAGNTATRFQIPAEGDLSIEGEARPGISMVWAEVRLPAGACPSMPRANPAQPAVLGRGELIQTAKGPVDPTSGGFTLRLDRPLRAGEIVTLRETGETSPQPLPSQEVGSGPLNWGPVRLYTAVGLQIFNPSGPLKPFATPVASGTVDVTLFARNLRMDHPLCFGRPEAHRGVPVNLFGESRLEPPTLNRSPGANLRQTLPARVFETGAYIPYSPRSLRYQYRGVHYALFGAPIARFGLQYGNQLAGSGEYWAAGLRFGAWKLARTDGKAAPVLLTYCEVLVGRWNSFLRTDPAGPRRAPLHYQFAWTGKFPAFAPSFGVRMNVGSGPNDYRFDILLRYELADLLHRVRRDGVSSLKY